MCYYWSGCSTSEVEVNGFTWKFDYLRRTSAGPCQWQDMKPDDLDSS